MMSNKIRHRFVSITFILFLAFVGVYLILYNLNESIIFYHPPSHQEQIINAKNRIRVGGLVKKDTIETLSEGAIKFTITDNYQELTIQYKGVLPVLFRPGQGIIAEGKIDKKSMIFIAESLLAKHDENYKPPTIEKIR